MHAAREIYETKIIKENAMLPIFYSLFRKVVSLNEVHDKRTRSSSISCGIKPKLY
jgi:hypothetical protein